MERDQTRAIHRNAPARDADGDLNTDLGLHLTQGDGGAEVAERGTADRLPVQPLVRAAEVHLHAAGCAVPVTRSPHGEPGAVDRDGGPEGGQVGEIRVVERLEERPVAEFGALEDMRRAGAVALAVKNRGERLPALARLRREPPRGRSGECRAAA